MRRCHPKETPPPLPRLWLFTDERVGEETLVRTVATLPRGSGIVFRHYRTPPPARRTLYERIRRLARRRGLTLVLAGTPAQALAWHADGWHGAPRGRSAPGLGRARRLIRSAPAHDATEMNRARRAGVDLIFLSAVFPTRSHPGRATLGPLRFAALAALSDKPVVALGGLSAQRYHRLRALGAYGWAAIDALTLA